MTDANSARELDRLRDEICAVGRRLYEKGFVVASEGNVSARLDEQRVVCTPTLQSKGTLTPEDLCLVDLQGRQLEGTRRRTSEVLLHLEIYRRRPDVRAVVHCHPPHATAFAMVREPIPQGAHPEVEFFLGEVPLVPYFTPGTADCGSAIAGLVERSRIMLLASHGTVSFDATVEQAFWWTEILEAYCRMLLLTARLGGWTPLTGPQIRELLELKRQSGMADPRIAAGTPDAELSAHPSFREHWRAAEAAATLAPRDAASPLAIGSEAWIERLAERVAEHLRRTPAGGV